MTLVCQNVDNLLYKMHKPFCRALKAGGGCTPHIQMIGPRVIVVFFRVVIVDLLFFRGC